MSLIDRWFEWHRVRAARRWARRREGDAGREREVQYRCRCGWVRNGPDGLEEARAHGALDGHAAYLVARGRDRK